MASAMHIPAVIKDGTQDIREHSASIFLFNILKHTLGASFGYFYFHPYEKQKKFIPSVIQKIGMICLPAKAHTIVLFNISKSQTNECGFFSGSSCFIGTK